MKAQKIIFISGWGTDSSVWNEIAKKIDVPVLFISWWDCLSGDSQDNLLFRLLFEVEQPVMLVGWSLGGMIALSAAHAFCEKVAGLVLISSSARMVADEGYTGVEPVVLKAMRLRLRKDKTGMLKEFADMADYPASDDAICKKFIETALSIDDDKLSKGLSYLQNFDIRDNLRTISTPVTVIHGKCDKIMNPANACYLRENLPNVNLELMPGSGHFLVQHKPEMVNRRILEFL